MPRPNDGDAETVRLQAEEHPLIEDVPPSTPAEHCLRLMHLRAYDEAVKRAAGRDVLDVGCNTGYGTIRFAPVAGRVVGVDVSPLAIEAARERALDGRPEFIQTSGFELPFPAASFDLVTSFQVLEHVPDATAFLRELARVLRPGGMVDPGHAECRDTPLPGDDALEPLPRPRVPRRRAGDAATYGFRRRPGAWHGRRARALRDRDPAGRCRATTDPTEGGGRRPTGDGAGGGGGQGRGTRIRSARHAGVAHSCRARGGAGVRSSVDTVRDGRAAHAGRSFRVGYRAKRLGARCVPTPEAAASVDLDAFLRFTVDDLWYVETDLDRSMDLLAVCEVHSATGPAPSAATI